MTTFTQAKSQLGEVIDRLEINRKRYEQAKSLLAQASASLGALATDYSALIQDINAGATDNSGNEAWTGLKAEKDLVVADGTALMNEVDAAKDALDQL